MPKCPLLNKNCLKENCEWWTINTMKNIQTQETYQECKCAINSIGPMLIELIKNTGSVQSAVESSRNETVKRQDAFLNLVGSRLLNVSRD